MGYKPVSRVGGWGSARPQRLFQILSILWDKRETEINEPLYPPEDRNLEMTTGQIARACGLKPSPHFREMLDELYGQGFLLVRAEDWRKNMQVFYWRIDVNTRWSEQWKAAFDAYLEPESVLA